MSSEQMPSKKLNHLVDELMKTKDPATVGLRKILKSKKQSGESFPLKTHTLEEMSTATKGQKIFSEDEKKIIALERENVNLKDQIKKLKIEAEKKSKDSYQRGLAEGKGQGATEGKSSAESEYNQKIEEIENKVTELVRNVEISRNAILKQAHKIILELSREIAGKIINTELTVNNDIVIYVIKKAISHIVDKHGFIVRVSPDDLSNVIDKKEFWTSISQRLEDISIEEDERIEKGGCIIESESGVADARIDVQLSEMKDVIDTAWESSMAGEVDTEEMEAPEPEVIEEAPIVKEDKLSEQEAEDDQQGVNPEVGIRQDQMDELMKKLSQIDKSQNDTSGT